MEFIVIRRKFSILKYYKEYDYWGDSNFKKIKLNQIINSISMEAASLPKGFYGKRSLFVRF